MTEAQIQRAIVTIPLRINSPANGSRGHWTAAHKRAKSQRGVTRVACARFAGLRETLPFMITLTRIGPREMDSDNLAYALKHVRDGVADALGVDDGDKRLAWVYEQERPAKGARDKYAVRIEVEVNRA